MRAALVIYGSLDTVSGGYLYDRRVVTHLRACGDDVEIISLPWRNYGRHLFDNGSEHLRDLLQHGGYDVVLQDELNHPSLFRLNGTLGPSRAPLVSIVHHLRCSEARPNWQNTLYRRVEQRYLNSVDAFIFNSRTTAAAVAGLLRQEKPSIVAPPGRDHLGQATLDVPPPDAGGPLRLLFVGNVIRRKGLHVLLQALTALPPEAWTLDVVGYEAVDPGYTREVDRLIAALPAGGRVVRHGRVSDAELAVRYTAADVLAVPSSYEGYGIVYAEALGHGLPVLATTQGAAAEIVEDSISGYLVPPEDAAQIAERLAMWTSDRRLLAAMSHRARERYHELPTWDETAVRIRSFLLAQITRHREVT
jgi:glycosyltransferase involved in cell wall biosynthesis